MSRVTSSGTEKTIWYMNAPAFIGETLFFHGMPSLTIITATEPCEVYSLESSVINEIFRSHPEITVFINKLMSQKIRVLTAQIEDLCVPEPMFRLAKLLYMLAKQNGKNIDGKTYIVNLSLTHQDIANITGLHRVTVSNLFTQLCKEQIIKKKKDCIIILSIEGLSKYFS